MSNVRFTAWLSERERQAIKAVEQKERVSANWVIRTAIRRYLGMDDEELPITSDTTDTEVRAG